MSLKEKIVNWIIDQSHGWNTLIHKSIEAKVLEESKARFPDVTDIDKKEKIIKDMREFYYPRMMTTIGLLVAIASCFISALALLVAFLAL
ncbi:hypothetical protein I5O50_05925 [Serratia ureilytica]|uniref:hypothetical protein n=1 Tax=Serratia ureilytica TaxID=300181 RepID=UPI0018D7E846|nr:hypothetical protein [Serratia ureilytica]MBH2596611.1 hypothetical protein [Serratia ureilytica]